MHSSILTASAFVISAFIGTSVAYASGITLNVVSYFDLPKNEPVTVEIFDDAKENVVIKKRFEDELREQGYTLSPDARLILSFETRDTSGKWSGGGPNRLIEMRNSENHTGKDAPEVVVSIYNNQRGGVLNPKRDPGITQVAPSEFRIDASIEDRTNGRRLWQGWTIIPSVGAEDVSIRLSMVKPIVANIGKTVRDQAVTSR
ncbi:hypothetical protein N8000_06850 [Rhodospirillales bacterium]|jgi:hypothetical protein|nr:hypothetical protein [Rhodospirillales bacterium]